MDDMRTDEAAARREDHRFTTGRGEYTDDFEGPGALHAVFVRSPYPAASIRAIALNPLGVKGVGEAGTVGALSATMNAVCHALQAEGVRHLDMPASPVRVWQALQDAKQHAH